MIMDKLNFRKARTPSEILEKGIAYFKKRKNVKEKFRRIDAQILHNLPHITAESDTYFIRVDLEKLSEVYKRAGEEGICPEIIDVFQVSTVYGTLDCIVRKKAYGTMLSTMYLEQYQKETLLDICEKLEDTINRMHHVGIAHGDLKDEHIILVMRENTVTKLYLFDFGEGYLKEWSKKRFEEICKQDLRDLKVIKTSIKARQKKIEKRPS